MKFHKNQIRAVSHGTGPAMILAGPGSGKTTVITHRVKNLIEHGVPPEKILVVTFTREAAVHMQRKFFGIMNGADWIRGSYPVSFGTFHSIFFRILKLEKSYNSRNILTEREKYQILREITIRKKLEVSSMNDFLQNISGEISIVKGNMIEIDRYMPKICNREEFRCVFEEYGKELQCQGKLDFDDMLFKCHQLFCKNPEILKQWQQIFQYILIDEFQDINYVQYEIIKMLALPENNLFVVGDDDQSIYGFRGACPELMFRFREDFPQSEQILLDVNYRSTGQIVHLSENLIHWNQKRFAKNIQADGSVGEKPDIRLFKTQREELEYVGKKINDLQHNGTPLSEIAILVRNNNQIPVIGKVLRNQRIQVQGGKENRAVYESEVAKDILHYVRAALNYHRLSVGENRELIAILNKPPRYISRQVLIQEGMDFKRLKRAYQHNREIKENIEKLEFDLSMISRLKPVAAIMYIVKGVGYEKYLKNHAVEQGVTYKIFLEQIEEIKNDAFKYTTLEKWLESISEKEEEKETETDSVSIMTMHRAKGLEFEAVFILDVNQGIIPTSKAVRDKEFEEERRVLYVGITRAKRVLGVYGITESLGCRVEPSMFLNEMIEEIG